MITAYVDSFKIKRDGKTVDFALELKGSSCKVWEGFGLPCYEGEIVGLELAIPDLLKELFKQGIIKESK